MQPRDDSPYRLLVEGPDDRHSLIQLMSRHGFNWEDDSITRPYVASAGGLPELLKQFPVVLKGSYDRIGVLVDANTHPMDRWEQLRSRAHSVGITLPRTPERSGTIVEGLRPASRLGLWLMPDNDSTGTLETFLSKLVPADDGLWSYSAGVIVEALRLGAPLHDSDHLKGRLHSWLAWQEEPGLPFGTAMRAKIFAHDTQDALAFAAWFERLFVDTRYLSQSAAQP